MESSVLIIPLIVYEVPFENETKCVMDPCTVDHVFDSLPMP